MNTIDDKKQSGISQSSTELEPLLSDLGSPNQSAIANTTQIIDYNEVYRLFVSWLATPAAEREHKTEKDFAEAHGVGTTALWSWKQKDSFLDDMHEATRRYLASNASKFTKAMTDNPENPKLAALAINTAFPKADQAAVQVLNINNMGSSSLDSQIDKLEKMLENGDSDE